VAFYSEIPVLLGEEHKVGQCDLPPWLNTAKND